MITIPNPSDAETHGAALREHAAYVRRMMADTGEQLATVDAEELAKLLELAAWAADVIDEIKRRGE